MQPFGRRFPTDSVYDLPGDPVPHRFRHLPPSREEHADGWRKSPSRVPRRRDGYPADAGRPGHSSAPPSRGDMAKRGRLHVTVLRAVGLRKSTNFVRLRFPEKVGRNAGGAAFYTQVETAPVFGNASPEWNESFELNPICHQDGGEFICHMAVEVEVVEEGSGLVHGRDTIAMSDLARGVDYYKAVECDEGQLFLELKALDFGRTGMEVTVIDSSGLWDDSGEVTILLRHYGQVKRTMALPGPDPVWRETFHFLADTRRAGAEVLGCDTITVEALVKERYGREESVGVGHFDLEPLECGRTRRKNVPVGAGWVTLEVTPLDFGHGKDMPQSLVHGADQVKAGFPEYRGPSSIDTPDYESKFQVQHHSRHKEPPQAPAGNFPSYAGLEAPGGNLQRKFEPLAPDERDGLPSPTATGAKPPNSPREQSDPDVGILHLTIVDVTDLAEAMDCAVRIQVEEKRIQSTTKLATAKPHFIESFKMYVRLNKGNKPGWRIGRQAAAPLRISLLDMQAGQEVGVLSLSLADLYEDKGTEVQGAHLLDKNGNVVGAISLLLKASGFGMRAFRGSLQCRVVQGSGLRIPDPETYIALRLRDEKFTTRCTFGHNPRWDESFSFHPDVFEKRGYVVCLDELHVALVEHSEQANVPIGTGVVTLSRLVRGQPETFMVDVGKQGTIRVELEADNFGMVGPDQADLYKDIPDPVPLAPDSPACAGHPMPPSAYQPQPVKAANRQKFYIPSSKRDADDNAIQSLYDELRQLQQERARLEQKSNEELDPLRMELNVLRLQKERASLHVERLRTPQRRKSLPHPDRPAGERAERRLTPTTGRRSLSDRWAEGPQPSVHSRPLSRPTPHSADIAPMATAWPPHGASYTTPQPWHPQSSAYPSPATTRRDVTALYNPAGWVEPLPYYMAPREGVVSTSQPRVPVPLSVGFGAPRY